VNVAVFIFILVYGIYAPTVTPCYKAKLIMLENTILFDYEGVDNNVIYVAIYLHHFAELHVQHLCRQSDHVVI
jgi:hypothetical protein